MERVYQPQQVNGLVTTAQGPIKTFRLRGVSDLAGQGRDTFAARCAGLE